MHVPLLNIPDELFELRASVRQFIDREIRPLEESHRPEIQETGTFEGITDERLKLRKRSAELGFWTLHMPEEVGGGGLSYLGQVLLHEEASLHGLILAHFESIFPVVTGPTPIYLDCTEAQREKYLQPLMRADKVTCFALTEPGAGSDATRIKTKAARRDDGTWVINGRKHFITGGDHADFALVFAVTDPQKRAHGGITPFLVDAGTRGYSVTRIQHTMSPYQNPVEITLSLPGAINTPQFDMARQYVGKQPQPVPPVYEPEPFAEAVVHTFEHPVRELPVGWGAQKLLWGQKLAPRAGDRMLLRSGWSGQHTGEDKPVGSPDNLFEPLPGDHGSRGRFGKRSRRSTLWTSLRLRRLILGAAVAGVGLATMSVTNGRAKTLVRDT